jgi:hypothetical protein
VSSGIADRRLAAQRITSRPAKTTPRALVSSLIAVQAQDYGAAKWAVALRLGDGAATDADVEEWISDGRLLRTHAFRGTWQLVAPEDIHWILALAGPREVAEAGRRHRQLELDAATFRRSAAALERALRDAECLTRDEIRAVLERARVSTEGQRLAHLLARAELDGLICSGPRRGKQSTHAALAHRASEPKRRMSRDAALRELALRYFRTRGPATLADFAWWSGLNVADAREGLESAKSNLVSETIGRRTLWRADTRVPRVAPSTHLLPAFDEYLIAYRDRSDVLDPKLASRLTDGGGILPPVVVIDGNVVGTWRRDLGRKGVRIAVSLWEAVPRAGRDDIRAAAERYAAFVELTPEIAISRA